MKKTLRRSMRAALRALPMETRDERSGRACRRMFETAFWRDARSVFIYLSLEYEVDTTALVECAWRDGKRVFAPKVHRDEGAMSPVEIQAWSDCLPGHRGIPEPIDDRAPDAGTIDLIVVPGLAFDRVGNRLGHGGGYYDRYFASPASSGFRCGFGFDSQVLDRLDVESHDQALDGLVSDAESLRFERPTREGR